jgi:hypothetical protein
MISTFYCTRSAKKYKGKIIHSFTSTYSRSIPSSKFHVFINNTMYSIWYNLYLLLFFKHYLFRSSRSPSGVYLHTIGLIETYNVWKTINKGCVGTIRAVICVSLYTQRDGWRQISFWPYAENILPKFLAPHKRLISPDLDKKKILQYARK